MKRIIYIILFFSLPSSISYAQNVKINGNTSEQLSLTNLSSPGDLIFGTVLANQGLVQIPLNDPNVVVFSIEGKEKENVVINISSLPFLQLGMTGSTIPFTLRAAYANNGNNNVNEAKPILGGTATFQILEGSNTSRSATAYLYIYGDLNVGNVQAGNYTTTITINAASDGF